jgi:hypothetical protein
VTAHLADYRGTGPAEAGRTRLALAIDGVAVVLVVIVAWPFPLFRLTLGVPWVVHVPLILAAVIAGVWVYGLVCAKLWGRTVAMYLLDLGLDGVERPFTLALSARWSFGLALAFAAIGGAFGTIEPAAGLPVRLSGLTTVSTA